MRYIAIILGSFMLNTSVFAQELSPTAEANPIHPLAAKFGPSAAEANGRYKKIVERKLQERLKERKEVCDSGKCLVIERSKMHPLQNVANPTADNEYKEFLRKYHTEMRCKSERCEAKTKVAKAVTPESERRNSGPLPLRGVK